MEAAFGQLQCYRNNARNKSRAERSICNSLNMLIGGWRKDESEGGEETHPAKNEPLKSTLEAPVDFPSEKCPSSISCWRNRQLRCAGRQSLDSKVSLSHLGKTQFAMSHIAKTQCCREVIPILLDGLQIMLNKTSHILG